MKLFNIEFLNNNDVLSHHMKDNFLCFSHINNTEVRVIQTSVVPMNFKGTPTSYNFILIISNAPWI